MSEEEAVAILEKVKTELLICTRGLTQYVGMCDAIFYVHSGKAKFSPFIIKVMDKINNDILMPSLNGNKSYSYLFPLTEEGYKKRIAYIDDLIRNIKDYV